MMRSALLPTLAVLALALPTAWVRGADPAGGPPIAEEPGGPGVSAKAAILVDAETGQVLYERNADEQREPASLTKIMTALLAVESGDLDRTVTVSKNAAGTGEASVNLEAGDEVALRDLLTAALLPSANDAAVAVAEHVGGSVPWFVERMNARAVELGCRQTHFENPDGLPRAGHVSSARDLATMAGEALRHPEFRRIVAMEKAQFAYRRPAAKGPQTREILSTNRLLRHEHPEHWDLADGVKTGYTRAAGRCLCASATWDGWQLLCVVLDCKDCWADGRNLLSWGFERYRRQGVVAANATTAEVHVLKGKAPTVEAIAKSSIDLIVPADQPLPRPRLSEGYPEAPVKAGDEVGELVVGRADGTQLSATLVAARDVPRSLAARVRDHAGGLVVAVVVLALIGALLVHGAVAAVAGARRYRIAQKVRRDRESRARDGQPSPGAAPGAEDQRPARPGAA